MIKRLGIVIHWIGFIGSIIWFLSLVFVAVNELEKRKSFELATFENAIELLERDGIDPADIFDSVGGLLPYVDEEYLQQFNTEQLRAIAAYQSKGIDYDAPPLFDEEEVLIFVLLGFVPLLVCWILQFILTGNKSIAPWKGND